MVYVMAIGANEGDALATSLGDVILAWSSAEREQVNLMAAILNLPQNKASRLYQKLPNFHGRTAALILLVDLHPEYESVRRHLRKLSSLSLTRNKYIHGSYMYRMDGADIRLIDYDQPETSDKRSKPTKPSDIRQHADAVRACALALQTARYGCDAELQAG